MYCVQIKVHVQIKILLILIIYFISIPLSYVCNNSKCLKKHPRKSPFYVILTIASIVPEFDQVLESGRVARYKNYSYISEEISLFFLMFTWYLSCDNSCFCCLVLTSFVSFQLFLLILFIVLMKTWILIYFFFVFYPLFRILICLLNALLRINFLFVCVISFPFIFFSCFRFKYFDCCFFCLFVF